MKPTCHIMELTPCSRVVSMDKWLMEYINNYEVSRFKYFVPQNVNVSSKRSLILIYLQYLTKT